MNISDQRRANDWEIGGPSDMRISVSDWMTTVDTLDSDKLTPEGLVKFKNMRHSIHKSLWAISVQSLLMALPVTYFVCGNARRSHSGYK